MTLLEAFKQLTDQRGWYKKCTNGGKPLDASTARSFKELFKKGRLTEAKMTSLLLSANYRVIPSQWSEPDQKRDS